MSCFCCPVCRQALRRDVNSLVCPSGHRFDFSRAGYVNLLRSQQSHSKRHGDDKRMLRARRAFLEKDYYAALRIRLGERLLPLFQQGGLLLDAGCGEGYYTRFFARELSRAYGERVRVCAVDISKDALCMIKPNEGLETAVASAFSLPLLDKSCRAIVNIFAPCAEQEFARVLMPGGFLIRAVPTARHLFGLKAAVYPAVRENPPTREPLPGFTLLSKETLTDVLHITDKDDIRSLFEMTPYYYKTSAEDQQRLLALDTLDTDIGFLILLYQKNHEPKNGHLLPLRRF